MWSWFVDARCLIKIQSNILSTSRCPRKPNDYSKWVIAGIILNLIDKQRHSNPYARNLIHFNDVIFIKWLIWQCLFNIDSRSQANIIPILIKCQLNIIMIIWIKYIINYLIYIYHVLLRYCDFDDYYRSVEILQSINTILGNRLLILKRLCNL